MDQFTRDLLSVMVPMSMGILGVLWFNAGHLLYGCIWLVGMVPVRILFSTSPVATRIRNAIKKEYSLAQTVADLADRHLLS
jgi:Cft2 family RNA processing exonuclease